MQKDILEFWFGRAEDGKHYRQVWFTPGPAFDQACTTGFLSDYERAAAGELDGWKSAPRSLLALVLLLDQFPRNMFRGTPRAFATDRKALVLRLKRIDQKASCAEPGDLIKHMTWSGSGGGRGFQDCG